MKIYFAGSIRGGRQDAELYAQLIEELKKYGEVLTEHIGATEMEAGQADEEIYAQDMQWLEQADLVVAEVTTPSLGVGYEIGQAVSMHKKVVCLYRDKERPNLSAMINGCPDVEVFAYSTLEEAKRTLKEVCIHTELPD